MHPLQTLIREACIGVGLGIIAGMGWRYSVQVPHNNRVDNFYKVRFKATVASCALELGTAHYATLEITDDFRSHTHLRHRIMMPQRTPTKSRAR